MEYSSIIEEAEDLEIKLTPKQVIRLITVDHGHPISELNDFIREVEPEISGHYDAVKVLAWLGY